MRELPTGTVTLLFTDIEGSTRLLQHLGERYSDALAECRALMRAAFHQHHGHEVDTQGDAFFLTFARATDAVMAAVAAQRALASHSWPEGVAVRVRMGLHTGEPERSTEGYVGLDVHRAARIMSAGHGGQVLLSQVTRDLVEHSLPADISLQDLGEHRLKDLGYPSHLYQLVIAGLAADFPPLKTLDSYAHNLPIQPTPFIGREKVVAHVQQQLLRQEVRLLTLTGPGGVGKTRLGLQVAAESSEHFKDGTWFVSLAPMSNPDLVIPTIAEILDVREAGGRSQLKQLKATLRERQMLLLLDNFEQVVSAATQVTDLLSACPQLKMLVTSREALHVRAEREFPVPALTLPDPKHLPDLVTLSQYEAVALFNERAQAVKPDFQVTNANAPAVAEICARLVGLPLAIELAAARTKHFPPQTLLARLEQGLSVLSGGARDLPLRQQTLRGALAWSYDLLGPEEQALFRRCAVFVGGCTWEAAEQVCTAAGPLQGDMLEGLASLVDKSLLRQAEQPEGTEQEARFWMLQVLREFGLECLASSGETEVTRTAHATCYLALAEEAEPHLQGAEQIRWFTRLEHEHENLRAALSWLLEGASLGGEGGKAQAEQALRLGGALRTFWDIRGHFREGLSFLERALAFREGIGVAIVAKALYAASEIAWELDNDEQFEALSRESVALFQELGDTASMAAALERLGEVAFGRGRYTISRARLEEAGTLFQEVGDTWMRGRTLTQLARISTIRGEYGRACAELEESLEIYRAVGDQQRIGWVLYLLARVLVLSQEDPERAQTLAEQSLALLQRVGAIWGIAYTLGLLGVMHLVHGDAIQARALLEESVETFNEAGNRVDSAESLISLARVAALQGDRAAARQHYHECLTILQGRGNQGKRQN